MQGRDGLVLAKTETAEQRDESKFTSGTTATQHLVDQAVHCPECLKLSLLLRDADMTRWRDLSLLPSRCLLVAPQHFPLHQHKEAS